MIIFRASAFVLVPTGARVPQRNVVRTADSVEDVTFTFAPTQVRGQRLVTEPSPTCGER
jgi:hypothetical protein